MSSRPAGSPWPSARWRRPLHSSPASRGVRHKASSRTHTRDTTRVHPDAATGSVLGTGTGPRTTARETASMCRGASARRRTPASPRVRTRGRHRRRGTSRRARASALSGRPPRMRRGRGKRGTRLRPRPRLRLRRSLTLRLVPTPAIPTLTLANVRRLESARRPDGGGRLNNRALLSESTDCACVCVCALGFLVYHTIPYASQLTIKRYPSSSSSSSCFLCNLAYRTMSYRLDSCTGMSPSAPSVNWTGALVLNLQGWISHRIQVIVSRNFLWSSVSEWGCADNVGE